MAEVKIHICRVQEKGTKPHYRRWWLLAEGETIVHKSRSSCPMALIEYEHLLGTEDVHVICYKGICSPAEAAMSLADVSLIKPSETKVDNDIAKNKQLTSLSKVELLGIITRQKNAIRQLQELIDLQQQEASYAKSPAED